MVRIPEYPSRGAFKKEEREKKQVVLNPMDMESLWNLCILRIFLFEFNFYLNARLGLKPLDSINTGKIY